MLPSNNNRIDMAAGGSIETSRIMTNANDAKWQLATFMGNAPQPREYISLGENCSSAWYLKQLGLKTVSNPFDWVFSSPDIILDCVNDNFKRYLDKSLIVPAQDNLSAGHAIYHRDFFNHRNPLKSDEDYQYYQRCCERFLASLTSQVTPCYLITLINEPTKRRQWAQGFTPHFPMPINQSLSSISTLITTLQHKNPSARFIVIDHYTNSEKLTKVDVSSENVFFIEFHAKGKSSGVFYPDHLDDFCFKLILTGLYGVPHNDKKPSTSLISLLKKSFNIGKAKRF